MRLFNSKADKSKMDKKSTNKQIRQISNSNSLLLLIFTVATTALGILSKYISQISGYGSIWQNPKFIHIIKYVFVYLILIPLLLIIFSKTTAKREKLSYKSVFKKSEKPFGWCFKWIVIEIGVSQFFGIISNYIINLFSNVSAVTTDELITSGNDIFGIVLYFIPMVVFAPFFEELFFRASLLRNSMAMGQWFAAVTTGLSFGLWHVNSSQFVMATFSGLLLSLIYIKTKSIWVCMAGHFINNMFVYLLTVSELYIDEILNSRDIEFVLHAMYVKNTFASIIFTISVLALICSCISGMVLLIIQFIKNRKRLALDKGRFQINALKKTAVYFCAPVTAIEFIIMILETLSIRII